MPRKRRNRGALASGSGEGVSAVAPVTERRFTQAVLSPSAVHDGRIENPDDVIRQFGGWEGLAFYERMLRQFPFLVGICNQWISAINAIDRAIKPGKPGDELSEKMAEQSRHLYSRIDGKETINARLLWGRFFGVALAEMVWEKDPATGLRAPLKVYDLDPWQAKFGPKGELYILTAKEPYKGEPADPSNFLIFRWGSRHTGYGKGSLQYVYMPTWNYQQLRRLMLQSIERFGRPIPWYRYYEQMDPTQLAALKATLAAQFKYYVATPTANAADERLEFPALNVVASGAAGRAELEAMRHFIGECYIALLGTQQTQDKTGGSRALEETRLSISGDQTPPGSQALDNVWTEQWLNRIWQVNAPNVDRSLWPKFDSDIDGTDSVEGSLLASAAAVITQYRREELTKKDTEELLVLAGMSRLKALGIVNDETKVEPPPVPLPFGAAPRVDDESNGEEETDARA